MGTQYTYDAFISYRHAPDDIKYAKVVQHQIERYRIPGIIRKETGIKRLSRVFRDQEDLAATSDLSDDIRRALQSARCLIVICSSRTKESKWVSKEINYFLESHTRKEIFTVIIEGNPYEVIPREILEEPIMVNGQKTSVMHIEVMSADYRVKPGVARKTELPRLISGLVKCDYRVLVRAKKHEERKNKVFAVCTGIVLILFMNRHKEEIRNVIINVQENNISSGSTVYELSFADSGLEDHPMAWNDQNLENAMREITGITDRDILLSDVWPLQELDLTKRKISDISSIEELTNLEALKMGENPIGDEGLSSISFLSNLNVLDVYNCGLSDLSALSNLSDLEELYIGQNSISDLSPLSDMKNLIRLDALHNQIGNDEKSLSCLSGLVSLTVLDLQECGVSDLAFMKNLCLLESTELSGNKISDISSLKSLTHLTYLGLANNEISDIEPLSELTGLSYLDLSNNRISGSLGALTKLHDLKSLILSQNTISDITALSDMTSLRVLKIDGNPIEDYSILDRLVIDEISK